MWQPGCGKFEILNNLMILNKKNVMRTNDSKTLEILKNIASQTRLSVAQVWDSVAVEILMVLKKSPKI